MTKKKDYQKPHEKGNLSKSTTDREEHSIISLQEKIIARTKINYWLFWLILGEIFGGSAFLAVLLSNGIMTWIGQLAFMYAIVFMLAGGVPIWANKQLNSLLPIMNNFIKLSPETIKEWYKTELERIFSEKGMVLTGIFIAVLGMASFIFQTKWYIEPETWWGTPAGDWTVTIVVSVLFFLCGMTGHMLLQIARMVHHIPNLPLEMTIYQHPIASIAIIGAFLQKLSTILAIGVGLISLTAVPLSPFRNEMGWVLIFWLIIAGICVITFFIFPQYRIHTAMANAKANKIREFATHISNALEEATREPSSERISYVKELLNFMNTYLRCPSGHLILGTSLAY